MGERRLVHALLRNHNPTAPASAGDEQLRRLVAHRDRVAALMRASQRVDPPAVAGAYRSSYAARLWAWAESSEPSEPGEQLEPAAEASAGPSSHLALVAEGDDW